MAPKDPGKTGQESAIKVAAWSGETNAHANANKAPRPEKSDDPFALASIPGWGLPVPGFGPGIGSEPPNGISELSPTLKPEQEKELHLMQEVVAVADKVFGQLEAGTIQHGASVADAGYLAPPDPKLLTRLSK